VLSTGNSPKITRLRQIHSDSSQKRSNSPWASEELLSEATTKELTKARMNYHATSKNTMKGPKYLKQRKKQQQNMSKTIRIK